MIKYYIASLFLFCFALDTYAIDRSAEIQQYIKILSGHSVAQKEETAEKIADYSGLSDKALFNFIESILIEHYQYGNNIPHEKKAPWIRARALTYVRLLIMSLASSGNPDYSSTLGKIAKESKTKGLRDTALTSLSQIKEFEQYNLFFQKNAASQPDLSMFAVKLKTLFESKHIKHKVRASKIIKNQTIYDERILDFAYNALKNAPKKLKNSDMKSALANICVALGRSGREKYRRILAEISKTRNSSTTRSKFHATEALKMLSNPVIKVENYSEGRHTDLIIKTLKGKNSKAKKDTLRYISNAIAYYDKPLYTFLAKELETKVLKGSATRLWHKEVYWYLMALGASADENYKEIFNKILLRYYKLETHPHKNKYIDLATKALENFERTIRFKKLVTQQPFTPSSPQSKIDFYARVLLSDYGDYKLNVVKTIFNEKISNAKLTNIMLETLSKGFNTKTDDIDIKVMAYMCRILGYVGDPKFKPLIIKIANYNKKQFRKRKLASLGITKKGKPEMKPIDGALVKNAERALTWFE